MSLRIRPMLVSDLPAILDVQAQCYPPAMQEDAAVVAGRLRAAPGTCAVAVDTRGVCAYLFAYPSRRGAVTDLGARFEPAPDADTIYLHDLAVAPRVHGKGLARRLVEHVLAPARERGWRWSALVAVQDSAGFWAGFGYRAATAKADKGLASYPDGAEYMLRALT